MSVKILRRTHAPLMRPAPGPMSTSIPGLISSKFGEIKSAISPLFSTTVSNVSRARKSADPEGFSVPDRIREFFFQNAPTIAANMDMDKIGEITSKLKMPLVVTIGIAAAAGLAYLVYKLYTNRATIAETVDNIMKDLKSVAPDLTKVEGWAESIKKEVSDALSGNSPDSALEKLAKIKDAVMGHQKSMTGAVGSGINFLREPRRVRGPNAPYAGRRRGAGLKVPLN